MTIILLQTYGVRTEEGEYTGFLGAIQRGTVDIFAADFTPTNDRLDDFDFTSYTRNAAGVVCTFFYARSFTSNTSYVAIFALSFHDRRFRGGYTAHQVHIVANTRSAAVQNV